MGQRGLVTAEHGVSVMICFGLTTGCDLSGTSDAMTGGFLAVVCVGLFSLNLIGQDFCKNQTETLSTAFISQVNKSKEKRAFLKCSGNRKWVKSNTDYNSFYPNHIMQHKSTYWIYSDIFFALKTSCTLYLNISCIVITFFYLHFSIFLYIYLYY